MTTERYDYFISIYNKFVTYTNDQVSQRSKDIAFMYSQLSIEFSAVTHELDDAITDIRIEEGKVYNRFKNDKNIAYTKVEIESYYIMQDEKVIELHKKRNMLKSQALFFENCLRGLINMGHGIRGFIDAEKFYHGEM